MCVCIYSFFFFFLFRAAPGAYGGSQDKGQIGATAACHSMPQPQQLEIQATSTTYTSAQGNPRSPTHWARPGIKPKFPWILVRSVSTEPQQELQPCIWIRKFRKGQVQGGIFMSYHRISLYHQEPHSLSQRQAGFLFPEHPLTKHKGSSSLESCRLPVYRTF